MNTWLANSRLLGAVLLTGLVAVAGCAGENSFEMACRTEGHEVGSAAYQRCLDEAYARNDALSARYGRGGP